MFTATSETRTVVPPALTLDSQTTAICFFIQPTGATKMAKPCYCTGEADNIVQDCFEQADWFGTHVTFAWGRGWVGVIPLPFC